MQDHRGDRPQVPAVRDAGRVVCFAQNTRDELRVVGGGVCGALAAEPGMKQQSYILSFVLDSN